MENRLEELRRMEVIGVTDGCRYGYLGDLLVELDSGQVRELVIPGVPRLFGLLGRGEDTLFPWSAVRRIGSDIILVEGEPRRERAPSRRKKFFGF